MFSRELTAGFRPVPVTVAAALIVVPLLWGVCDLQNSEFRSNLDVLNVILSPPTGLLLPLAASTIGCSVTAGEIRHRFIANTRVRTSAHELIRAKLAAIALWCGVPFFLYAFLPTLFAFYVWPALGNPGVDPIGFNMTPAEATADSLTRVSYSQLLAWGPLPYSFMYSLWVALGGIVFAWLTLFCLVFKRSIAFGMALPVVLYFGETVAAELVGYPRAGLAFSLIPFGLTQGPILVAAAPVLIFAGATVFLWLMFWRRVPYSDILT